jgi:imidazole glycerol-phosphate synthase subunit HisH
MITIIDYNMGNLGSILNMCKRIGVEAQIAKDIEMIYKANKILLPGVGAFDAAVSQIDKSGLREILIQKANFDKIPFLGICLGMQLLTLSSEEGSLKGLGLIEANTLKFSFEGMDMKVPHMGWNFVKPVNESALIKGFTEEFRFYFVHSYYVKCKHINNVIMQTEYGFRFDSIIQKDNIFGAQFHPEKSHKYGMKLLENFSKL